MAINKIEVSFNNKYEYDIADVNYNFCEVKINFDEEIEINMSSEQFVNLKAKMDEVYKEMFGINEAV